MRKAMILATGLLLAGAVTGCAKGAEKDPAVATGDGAGASVSSSFDPAKYSKCMRDNGMDWFPEVTGTNTNVDIPDDVDRDKLNTAMEACRKFAPTGAAGPAAVSNADNQAKLLQYAKCMRSNGVPDFPDPKADGTGPGLDKSSGIDITSPTFEAAEKACRNVLPEAEEENN